ncbi:MAG: hypothetical protein IPQ05_15500 [Leptospiraceae bacterium]|nr:hypothetical protein [Leptospiraceae bacterium]MBL0265223.1 hypothetical protein [Leptospiraceae bacterium]
MKVMFSAINDQNQMLIDLHFLNGLIENQNPDDNRNQVQLSFPVRFFEKGINYRDNIETKIASVYKQKGEIISFPNNQTFFPSNLAITKIKENSWTLSYGLSCYLKLLSRNKPELEFKYDYLILTGEFINTVNENIGDLATNWSSVYKITGIDKKLFTLNPNHFKKETLTGSNVLFAYITQEPHDAKTILEDLKYKVQENDAEVERQAWIQDTSNTYRYSNKEQKVTLDLLPIIPDEQGFSSEGIVQILNKIYGENKKKAEWEKIFRGIVDPPPRPNWKLVAAVATISLLLGLIFLFKPKIEISEPTNNSKVKYNEVHKCDAKDEKCIEQFSFSIKGTANPGWMKVFNPAVCIWVRGEFCNQKDRCQTGNTTRTAYWISDTAKTPDDKGKWESDLVTCGDKENPHFSCEVTAVLSENCPQTPENGFSKIEKDFLGASSESKTFLMKTSEENQQILPVIKEQKTLQRNSICKPDKIIKKCQKIKITKIEVTVSPLYSETGNPYCLKIQKGKDEFYYICHDPVNNNLYVNNANNDILEITSIEKTKTQKNQTNEVINEKF